MMLEICFFLVFFDVWFYHVHVWLHSKSMFKYHKVLLLRVSPKERWESLVVPFPCLFWNISLFLKHSVAQLMPEIANTLGSSWMEGLYCSSHSLQSSSGLHVERCPVHLTGALHPQVPRDHLLALVLHHHPAWDEWPQWIPLSRVQVTSGGKSLISDT